MGAGLRLGWALPGRWRDEVERLKFLGTLGTPAPTQLAVAEYLEHGDWDLQLRRARRRLVQRRDILRTLGQRLVPAGTRLSEPSAGFLRWALLADGVSSLELYRRALAEGVTVTPGRVFSNADLYARCLRLNYSHEWTPEREAGLRRMRRSRRRWRAAARTPDQPGRCAARHALGVVPWCSRKLRMK